MLLCLIHRIFECTSNKQLRYSHSPHALHALVELGGTRENRLRGRSEEGKQEVQQRITTPAAPAASSSAADGAADGAIATMVDNAEIKEVAAAAAVATGVVIEEEPIKDALGGATGEVSSEGAQQPLTRHQLHARSPPINQSIS